MVRLPPNSPLQATAKSRPRLSAKPLVRNEMTGRGLVKVMVLMTLLRYEAAAEECKPRLLHPAVLTLVEPYLKELAAAATDEFTEQGVYREHSPHRDRADSLFSALLKDDTTEGDEALAYLLNIYVGEHGGEELVCEVINRGKRMMPLVNASHACVPLTGLAPLPKFVRGSGTLPGMAIKGIEKGQPCTSE